MIIKVREELWSELKSLETKIGELQERRIELLKEEDLIRKQLDKAYVIANACKVLLREKEDASDER